MAIRSSTGTYVELLPVGFDAARCRFGPRALSSAGPARRAPSVGAWRSLVARIVRDDEVGGSNPRAPTRSTSSLSHGSDADPSATRNNALAVDARPCQTIPGRPPVRELARPAPRAGAAARFGGSPGRPPTPPQAPRITRRAQALDRREARGACTPGWCR